MVVYNVQHTNSAHPPYGYIVSPNTRYVETKKPIIVRESRVVHTFPQTKVVNHAPKKVVAVQRVPQVVTTEKKLVQVNAATRPVVHEVTTVRRVTSSVNTVPNHPVRVKTVYPVVPQKVTTIKYSAPPPTVYHTYPNVVTVHHYPAHPVVTTVHKRHKSFSDSDSDASSKSGYKLKNILKFGQKKKDNVKKGHKKDEKVKKSTGMGQKVNIISSGRVSEKEDKASKKGANKGHSVAHVTNNTQGPVVRRVTTVRTVTKTEKVPKDKSDSAMTQFFHKTFNSNSKK